jgi:hypothetical protein
MSRALDQRLAGVCIGALLSLTAATSHASERDPMVPPVGARPAPPLAKDPTDAAAPAAAALPVLRQILVVDGKHYVAEGSRLRGIGERLGGDGARIERIDDSGVWLRDGGVRKRLPLYGAVTKQAAAESPAMQATAAHDTAPNPNSSASAAPDGTRRTRMARAPTNPPSR